MSTEWIRVSENLKIQFLSLDSNISKFGQAQSHLVADFLARGCSISRVFCNSMLKGSCIPLEELEQATKLSKKDLDLLCSACKRQASSMISNFDTDAFYLDDYLDQGLYEQYALEASSVCPESWHKFCIDEFAVGKISAYEFFLKYKLDSGNIPEPLFDEYKQKLLTALKVLASAPSLLMAHLPESVISFNHLYSPNNAYTQIANRMGISTFSIQHGEHSIERLQTLNMFKTTKVMLSTPASPIWKTKESEMPSSVDVKKTISHFQGLITGKSGWTYSEKMDNYDPRKILKITDDNPVILVTLSSEDEIFSAGLVDALPETGLRDAFPNQMDFIHGVLEAASLRKELNFIIRIHPRMLSNKRDSRNASSLDHLKEILNNSSKNVFVNWPSHGVSIYDLFRITNVGLNYRSQTGYEMLACGIPVVVGISKYHIRPISGFRIAENALDMVKNIDQAIIDGPKVVNSLSAFKWYGFVFNHHVAPISQSASFSFSSIRPKNNGTLLSIWRKLTKLVQLRIPIVVEVIEKLELRGSRDRGADSRFFEVVAKTLDGIHMSNSESLGPATSEEVAAAANGIRKLVGLTNL